ncbi:hypothetical protein OKW40_002496 [Paraburkholderia sp. RAU6.4a]|nr:hypothetical protein [Paraburkholderia sp. MM5384-R2]
MRRAMAIHPRRNLATSLETVTRYQERMLGAYRDSDRSAQQAGLSEANPGP